MMRYGLFTERMKALFAAKKPDEHMFLLSIDFLNFKLVNHLYGPARGTELLRAAADYLDQIPEILLWDRIYADSSRSWCAPNRRILSRLTDGMPWTSGPESRRLIRPATCGCPAACIRWRTEMFWLQLTM